ncbi:MAG: 30S ribosomal protein S16 [Planctomycetota bacterium]
MVRIRMSRMGRTHRPFYRINAVEKKTQRDGKVLENLGWYDPMAKEDKQISLKTERIQHWLGKGAQPSDTCKDLFADAGLIDAEAWKAERMKRLNRKIAARDVARVEAEEAAKREAEAKAAEEKAAAAEAAAAPEAGEGDAPAEESKDGE